MGGVPHVTVRVDASTLLGTGHLRRCLSLAQALIKLGARVDLLTRRLDSVASQVLSGSAAPDGLGLHWLPPPVGVLICDENGPPHQSWAGVRWTKDVEEVLAALQDDAPDWMVIDHYAFDERWHSAVRDGLGCRILVIDDTADRMLDADALLDQNWDSNHKIKYANKLRRWPTLLIGPHFALIDKAFRNTPRYSFNREVRSLGIFMGGTDPGGVSVKVLKTCRGAGFFGFIEVVSTSANPHLNELRAACANTPNTLLTINEPALNSFFARHDLQIGAGGGATWERCCIGVPVIAMVLTANQMAVVPALDKLGVLRAARLDDDVVSTELPFLSQVLAVLLADAGARRTLAERAALLVDGRGAQRVALSLLGGSMHLRPATLDDANLLHEWRNHPSVRAVSGSGDSIDMADHLVWMRCVLAASDRWMFVAEVGRLPVGCIRFDQSVEGCVAVSLYLDPELSGLGLGQILLFAGEDTLSMRLGGSFTVYAHVMAGNAASQKLFQACGYDGGPLEYHKTVDPRPTFR